MLTHTGEPYVVPTGGGEWVSSPYFRLNPRFFAISYKYNIGDYNMRKIRKIVYDVKRTQANTTYITLPNEDREIIVTSIIGVMCYMQELSLSKNQDIKDFANWFKKSNKRYLYNTKLSSNNSPQSYLAGTMNNLQFGTQYDFSLVQLEIIQDILNTSIDVIDAISEQHKIDLQSNQVFTKVWIQENIWHTN